MTTKVTLCPVLNEEVTIVTDPNGKVTNIVCPQFLKLTHGCNIKNKRAGVLGMVAGKLVDKIFNSNVIYCEYGDPNHLGRPFSG